MPTPLIARVPRAPFSKPLPGTGIDPRQMFAKGLVHSYPFNEGRGQTIRNYAQPSGLYDLRFRVPFTADSPIWGTFDRVNGLRISLNQANPLETKYGNTGTTNPNITGANLLPCIDLSKGFTIHLWMRPVNGTIFGIPLISLGPINEGVRMVVFIHLTRFAASGTDWWRRNIQIFSNGSASTTLTNSDEVWVSPSLGGAVVGIDSLPYEHVISVIPSGPSGSIRWYSSDGYDFGFAGTGVITPPDNNQYWPVYDPSGQQANDVNLWGMNVFNYAMGRESAFALMRNPLQMYKARASGGGYAAEVIPPYPAPPDYPPSSPTDTPPEDISDIETIANSCIDTI